MVYFRKYRPQTITELDSIDLREKLSSLLSAKSISQAFLFAGPKGLGKTSTARIVAKIINCEANSKLKTQNKDACNKCFQCISITNGSNLDILEIDAASNRGIDEIRDLREKVRLAPASAKTKVYIIDEVHMLTNEAFNALLKTLEEPPSRTMFILCTTEFHKVPETIVSRCFVIQFKKATQEELVSSFSRIAKGEKIEVDKDALFYIAKLSDGSFRDGAKILEELVTIASGKPITKELVDRKYQVLSIGADIVNLLDSLKNKDAMASLKLINHLREKGTDIKYFTEELLATLNMLLLVQFNVIPSPGHAANFTVDEITQLANLFSEAYQQLRYAVIPQLPLELAILEYTQAQNQAVQPSWAMQSDKKIWEQFITIVKSHNHSLAGVLRGCYLKSFENNTFVIETGFTFHKEKLKEEKAIQILQEVGKEITGKNVEVLVELKEKR